MSETDLDHFNEQFSALSRTSDRCAPQLRDIADAGRILRTFQRMLERETAAEAQDERRIARAERHLAKAQADRDHWSALTGRDHAELVLMIGTMEDDRMRLGVTQEKLDLAAAAYDECRAAPGGHERGACQPESDRVREARVLHESIVELHNDHRRERLRLVRVAGHDDHEFDRAVAEEGAAAAERTAAMADLAAAQGRASQLVFDIGKAESALADARAALKDCRQHHQAHHCGERGGPGVRKADGECASWEDVERSHHHA